MLIGVSDRLQLFVEFTMIFVWNYLNRGYLSILTQGVRCFELIESIGVRPANFKCVCDLRHIFLSISWLQETIPLVDNVEWFFPFFLIYFFSYPLTLMLLFMMALWRPSLVSTYCPWSGNRPPTGKGGTQHWFNRHFYIPSAVFSSVVSADNPFPKWMLSPRPFSFSLQVLNCSQE